MAVAALYDFIGDYMDKHKEATWRIMPTSTPTIIRHCSKCNRKMEYYCSEKFRVNANQARVDIWLIYKCSKCDSTWKLTIKKGIRPRDVPPEVFEKFINNDKALAWQYAFDRYFLKQNACVVDYANVEYDIEGLEATNGPMIVQLQSPFIFELKLSALLAKALCVSVGQIKKLVANGAISVNPDCDIMKYRIKADLDITIDGVND